MVYRVPRAQMLTLEEKAKEIEALKAKIAQFEQVHPDVVEMWRLLQEYGELRIALRELEHPPSSNYRVTLC